MVTASNGGVSTGQLASLGGAVVAIGSVFLPWITISVVGQSGSLNGLDMLDIHVLFNGVVTLLLAVVVGALVILGDWNETTQAIGIVFGGIVALVGVVYIAQPSLVFGSGIGGRIVAGISDVGLGILGTILGGVVMLVGGVMDFVG